jgi:hypothetical protein
MSRQLFLVPNRPSHRTGKPSVDRCVRRLSIVAEEIDRSFSMPLARYLQHSLIMGVLSTLFLYVCFLVFLVLDILVSAYQAVCFPIYEIPKVHRMDYFRFGPSKPFSCNRLERLKSRWCSYTNGLIAYVAEIAARTEDHWCPVDPFHKVPSPHSR